MSRITPVRRRSVHVAIATIALVAAGTGHASPAAAADSSGAQTIVLDQAAGFRWIR